MGQRYRRMEDQKPGPDLARNQDFAEDLNQASKCFKKMCQLGKHSEQTGVTKMYHRRDSGLSPQPLVDYL